jgi:hypothetical protein
MNLIKTLLSWIDHEIGLDRLDKDIDLGLEVGDFD